MKAQSQFGANTASGAGVMVAQRRDRLARTRGAAPVRVVRLVVLLLLVLAASAVVTRVAFAGAQEDATLTERVITAVEVKIQKLWEKGEKFVNDLRLLNKVKELAESNEAKQASQSSENSEQKVPASKIEK